jgi:hypothetical protein
MPDAAPTDASAGPTIEEVRDWIGHQVDDMAGGAAGRLESFLVDAESGTPEWLVVRTGRLGARSLVPAQHAVAAVGRVWVPFTRDEIRSVARGDGSKGLSRGEEQRLLEHYGIGAGAGRAVEIGDRDENAVTARPAG